MANYDFRVLSPIDFENLVRDLLQRQLKITLESFSSGRDTGIDFRYISVLGRKLIVQCKHYPDTKFTTLLSQLRRNELPKDIFATSQPLTPAKKSQVAKLFRPFILRTSDIYGRDDLNNLLGKYKSIERDNIKLWFSSSLLMERLLHTRRFNLTRETISKVQRDAKLYVRNDSFSEALRILETHNFCLIVGVPGIGKTMLAEMLLLRYYSKRFEIIKIENDITEASGVDYINKKRMFYYDDFLGQASIAEKLKKNEDQSLLDFILAIKRSRVSKLILTTREYILNNTKLVYEKIDRTRFDLETCVVDLAKYTRLNRAKILFNHIYFSDLSPAYRKALLADRSYLDIIDHENYSPRIIEYLTDPSRLRGVVPKEYVSKFVASLDNPEELWRHAFTSQLLPESRDLLLILVTLPREVFLENLETTFRLYRKKNLREGEGHSHTEAFKRALKELDGNFITTDKSGEEFIVRFHNPSVRDFLQNYLAASLDDLQAVLRSIACFDQLHWLWEHRDARTNRYRFRPIIRLNLSADFLTKMEVSLQLPVFSMEIRYTQGEFLKRRTNVPLANRILLISSIVSELKTNRAKELLRRSLVNLNEAIDSSLIQPEDLVNLVKGLEENVDAQRWKELLATTREFLANGLVGLDDYRALTKFLDSYPGVFSKTEVENLAKAFPSFAQSFVWHLSEDDPDELRTYAEEISSIGEDLGASVFDVVNELEEKAQEEEDRVEQKEREQDTSSENVAPPDFAKELREVEHEVSDREIESMFSSLR
jgi:hypothetical protein